MSATTDSLAIRVVEKAFDRVDALAVKAGQTVEHFWPMMVKRTFVLGIFELIGFVFVIAMSAAILWWANKSHKQWLTSECRHRYEDDVPNIAKLIVGILMGSISLIGFSIEFTNIVGSILSPEAQTLLKFMGK